MTKVKKRLILALVLSVSCLVGMGFVSPPFASDGDWAIIGSISGFTDPTGITFDGTWIWATEQHWPGVGTPLYRINPETLVIEDTTSIAIDDCCVQGLAWDGQYIWISGNGYEQYRYNPVTSELVHTCTRPSNPQPSGLGAVGDTLYATGWYGGTTACHLMRFDPYTCGYDVIATLPSLSAFGLAWTGSDFLICMRDIGDPGTERTLYKYSAAGEQLGRYEKFDFWAYDVAWDGEYVWVCAYNSQFAPDGQIHKILLIEPSELPPEILTVEDVPKDQGGNVTIRWKRSAMDIDPIQTVTFYSIWRSLTGDELISMRAQIPDPIDPAGINSAFEGPAYRLMENNGVTYAWEWLANQPAHYFETYAFTAATLYDSIGNDPGYHFFLVSAHTSDPFIFWDSTPDSGYSVDNLAPIPPQGFVGTQDPAGLKISWNPNEESDLSCYALYRGTESDFVPGPENLLIETPETTALDSDWQIGALYHYKLYAKDIHGNESPAVYLAPDDIVPTLLQNVSVRVEKSWIEVSWQIAEAGEGMAFCVLRKQIPDGHYMELLHPDITTEDFFFTCRDKDCRGGATYRYRVDVSDEKGKRILFETDPIKMPITGLFLYQNYPNPFNPSTVICFTVPENTLVELSIFDLQGRLVITLVDELVFKGLREAKWDGRDTKGNPVSSGVYFYRLRADRQILTKKMILLK